MKKIMFNFFKNAQKNFIKIIDLNLIAIERIFRIKAKFHLNKLNFLEKILHY